MADRGKILFATVGTGNIEDLEKTLLIPLKKSILKGEWQEVVLLPSQETARSAQLLHDELQGIPIVMEPLPGSGQENDADKTYVSLPTSATNKVLNRACRRFRRT